MAYQVLTPQQVQHLLSFQNEYTEEAHSSTDSPLLRLLASIEREKLTPLLHERRCVSGEVIVRQGDMGDSMFLIWSGRVVAYSGDLQSPNILGFRGAGEIIGEMALLEEQPRTATVVTLDEVRLLEISKENFYNLLKSDPEISLGILGTLSTRLRESDQARSQVKTSEKRLIDQVSELKSENQQLLELQRLRQETSDLIIHDLRNPLGAISLALNMLEMVLPENILNENRQLLEIARYSNNRLIRLVESLLEVSRMEAGESQFTFEPFDLTQLLRSVADGLLIARKRQIQVVTQLPEKLIVTADRDKLERIVQNLLDNALKFTPNDGWVKLSAKPQENETVVSVTDNGRGIPASERQRVFERFAQVQGEKRSRRGFGLGLVYCRLAVEAHGGRIWVEPGEAGVGSCFRFTLPNSVDAVKM